MLGTSVTASVHTDATSKIHYRVYADLRYAVIKVDSDAVTALCLFAGRAELVRLRDAISAAMADLDDMPVDSDEESAA